jgi:hypothetical protein
MTTLALGTVHGFEQLAPRFATRVVGAELDSCRPTSRTGGVFRELFRDVMNAACYPNTRPVRVPRAATRSALEHCGLGKLTAGSSTAAVGASNQSCWGVRRPTRTCPLRRGRYRVDSRRGISHIRYSRATSSTKTKQHLVRRAGGAHPAGSSAQLRAADAPDTRAEQPRRSMTPASTPSRRQLGQLRRQRALPTYPRPAIKRR